MGGENHENATTNPEQHAEDTTETEIEADDNTSTGSSRTSY